MLLKTRRLLFSPLNCTHIDQLLPIYNDALTMKYIPNNPPRWSEAELLQKFINNPKDVSKGIGIFAITIKESGQFLGHAGIYNSFDDFEHLEIGYILSSRYWNEGYGTEIAKGLISYCFTYLKTISITTRMYAEHLGSIRISEKSGMTFVEQTVLADGLYRLTYKIQRPQ